jgi:hypothetical protein
VKRRTSDCGLDRSAPTWQRRREGYTGEELKIRDSIEVEVAYGEQHKTLPLLVVASEGPSLIGRDWLLQIQGNN